MEFFTLRQCAMNCGFGGWVSSFIISEVTVCDVWCTQMNSPVAKIDRFHYLSTSSVLWI